MKYILAPWRWKFISGKEKSKGCVFCNAVKNNNNKESLIVFRGKNYFIILNKYPYNTGHLMIVPYMHTNDFSKLKDPDEFYSLIDKSVKILKSEFNPDGFNIGMNLGRTAGAGIEDHIHLHIVPRWQGDSNFMAVIGNTKLVSYDIEKIRDVLERRFSE